MQYWKPEAEDEFAGDMMPFWDGERFHLFYLLDRGHHAEQGGLGGHQWAHAVTSDLVTWKHYPPAIPRGEPGSVDENGICTGSIFEHEGIYYAFYATRIKNEDGSVSEAVCRAVSRDLIRFDKSADNPMFFAPPGYDQGTHRDPFVIQHPETGVFHMLVTASRDGRGVLAHYSSENLDNWQLADPFLTVRDGHSPECPELFVWNGWWYLIYSHDAQLEYRVARGPLGPWQKAGRETIEGSMLRVPRTAEFAGGRRLAAGFVAWRDHGRDDEGYVYAGNTVFRELFQDDAGTLWTRFVPEMMPKTGPVFTRQIREISAKVSEVDGGFLLTAGGITALAGIAEMPADYRITLRMTCEGEPGPYGLLLRADAALESGYRLCFTPRHKQMTLQRRPEGTGKLCGGIEEIEGTSLSVDIVICLKGSIIDVCINGRQTAVERGFDMQGSHLGFFAEAGTVRVEHLQMATIL